MKILEKLSEYGQDQAETREFLIKHTKKITLLKNDILSEQGSRHRNVYFVESGLLRSFYIEKGKEITIKFYMEGKLAAPIDTLFNEQTTRYTIEAIEDSEVLVCDYRKIEAFCNTSIAVANFGRYILGKLMSQMYDRIASLQFMTAKERYDELMRENPNIILRAPLGMIAGYLGITQETLSRIRAKG